MTRAATGWPLLSLRSSGDQGAGKDLGAGTGLVAAPTQAVGADPWPAGAPPVDPEAVRRFQLLVARAQAGDMAVFTDLFETHRPRLLRVAHGILHDPMASEDVVQEGWIRAWQAVGRARFAAPGQFGAWLGSIVGHLAIDLVRQGRPRLALDGLADRLPDDEDVAERATTQALLATILADLQPEDRRLLELIRDDVTRTDMVRILSAAVGRPLTRAGLRQRIRRANQAARRTAARLARG